MSRLDQSSILQNDKDQYTNNEEEPELPENTRVMLISAIYSGENQKVQLKFYDPYLHVIYFWQDKTDHKPYCYTKLEYQQRAEEIAAVEKKFELKTIPKMDLMTDKVIQAIKITAPDPLSIGGKGGIREKLNVWVANIKYHENYLYDTRLIPGSYYKRKG